MLEDFEAFLEKQKPHVETELRTVRKLRSDRSHLKRPTREDYEYVIEETETLTKQGIVTIVQFAAWKGVDRTTINTNYSAGIFKDAYKHIKATCEAYSERRLYESDRNSNAIMFAMKNSYNWVDKTETELSGSLDTPLSKEAQAVLNKVLNGGDEDVSGH